jgi:hypothetical protein
MHAPHPRSPDSKNRGRRDALDALRGREVPDGFLDGVYASVRERAPFAPVQGGLTLGFLEAPRALRLWRNAAVAASLLLAGGVGWVAAFSGSDEAPRRSEVPLSDVPGVALEGGVALEEFGTGSTPARAGAPRLWPAHRSGRAFFLDPAVQPVSASRPAGPHRFD